jgi:hypothetical protein
MTTTVTPAGHDLPTRKIIIGLVVIALGALVYFTGIKPAVHQHTLDVRAERRAACSTVPAATEAAIVAGLDDTGGREIRSLRAKPGPDGWWFVSADMARPGTSGGFTGDLTTWRVRDGEGHVIESVDKNAQGMSTFPAAPGGVSVRDEGGFDSRWCAKNAALSP